MLDYVVEQCRVEGVPMKRLAVLHCDLGKSPGGHEIEWPGTKELAAEHAAHYGLRFIMVQRGVRGFIEQVEYRGKWPANQQRYCTSKFKQDQGNKAVTALANEAREEVTGFLEQIERLQHWPRSATRNCTSTFKRDQGQRAINRIALEVVNEGPDPDFFGQIERRGMFSDQENRLCTSNNKRDPANTAITALADEVRNGGGHHRPRILQCFGFRAQESSRRRKMATFSIDKRTTNTRKQVHVWLPVHAWNVEEVWARNSAANTRSHPALEDYQVGLLADLKPRPSMFWAYDPGDDFSTLESAARRLFAAGFRPGSHRIRCYVLIGHPGDSFADAESRLRQMVSIGFMPMAMLWRPDDKPSQQRHEPSKEWRDFQRKWARPAITNALIKAPVAKPVRYALPMLSAC